MDSLRHLDDRSLHAVNGFARHTGWLHAPMRVFAGNGAVVLFGVLLLAGVWWARRRQDQTLAAAGWACLATLLAVAVNQPIVHAVSEARPYTTHPGLLVLATRSTDASFPSDHATMAGAAAAGLLLLNRRLGTTAAVLAVLLAFGRVYIAAHYPWDVLAGLALSTAVTILGWRLLHGPLTSITRWLRTLPGLRATFAPTPGAGSPSTATASQADQHAA